MVTPLPLFSDYCCYLLWYFVSQALGGLQAKKISALSDACSNQQLLEDDPLTGWRRLSSDQPYPFNTGCDFDVVYLDGIEAENLINNNKLPERYADWLAQEPLLVKRRKASDIVDTDDSVEDVQSPHPNELFQNLTTKAYMTEVYGDYLVGVDFPGRDAPPTERWEQIPLKEYIARFVDGDWDMEKRATSHTSERYLFGPSDTCHTHIYMTGYSPRSSNAKTTSRDVCHEGTTLFQQLWMDPELAKQNQCIVGAPHCEQSYYGLGGSYSGTYFGDQDSELCEVVHGQKLWLTYSQSKYKKLTANGAFGKFDDVRKGDVSAAWFVSKVFPTLPRKSRPKRCVAEQGDVVYVPRDTVRLTMNLGDTMYSSVRMKRTETRYIPEFKPPRSCTIPRYSSENVSPELMPSLTKNWTKCFVLTDIVSSWPGVKKWTPKYLVDSGVGPPVLERNNIFDGTILDSDHEEVERLRADCPRADFDTVLGKNLHFASKDCSAFHSRRYIIRGQHGLGGALHTDPARDGFWHAHLQGRKRWMFMPESRVDWLKVTHQYEPENILARDFFEEWAPLLRGFEDVDECDIEEGETVVCPHDVWHNVLHLSPHTASCSEQLLYDSNTIEMMNFSVSRGLEDKDQTGPMGFVTAARCKALLFDDDKAALFEAACRNKNVTNLFNGVCSDACPNERFMEMCEKLCGFGESRGMIPTILQPKLEK
eukprot:CAMPEP_0118639012 /NCGR_PEP_ID=MMETSP0785-20121206/3999_1 /TAXON_ID=91992 /ORGANISM="Bolidomonas pacifica, Strain CCMP 1866" /LENGTH=705 /DNA_ID=CAMNT_0006530317 /DNA_START=483 /DNA_END=2599 /DNA_ORIENTATION=+